MFKSREQGITLIALVITIIVLLILAGVSIAMLTGENGILTQAQKAKNETEESRIEEENRISEYEDYINDAIGEVKQVDDKNPGVLEGEGTEESPFIINSIEDLVAFADNVTKGTNIYKDQYVKLGISLDFNSDKSYVDPNREDYYGYQGKLKEALLQGEGFQSIGKIENTENLENLENIKSYSFNGVFDGNNKSIFNMYINKNVKDNTEAISLGMFSNNFGTIKNLTISGNISLVVSNQERKSRRNNRNKLWRYSILYE